MLNYFFVDTINNKFPKNITLTIKTILWIVALITILCVFVPFSPKMPGVVDGEQFAMNYGLAQGLSFGKDIIYTYGPYAFLYSMQYHPSTDFLMIIASLYLAVSYGVSFVLLAKKVKWYWILVFCAFLAGLMYYRDALLSSLPLLVGLLTFKILSPEKEKIIESKWASIFVIFLFAPLGLLPLVKGNMSILCGAVVALCVALFLANKERLLAIICLLTPIISMIFCWIASGQSVINLPSYFINMAPTVSGYTEAMAANGPINEIILYLITSVFLLLIISFQTQITRISRIFLFCLYFVFLFLSFKAGFVRHDIHAVVSAHSILIAALLLPFILKTRTIFLVIFFALLSWYSIDSNYIKTSPESFVSNIKSTYSLAWYGIGQRIENRNWLKLEFDATVKFLREQASFPVFQGTTDIYSYDQPYLIASGNSWSPRPVFQSYAAYTTELAEINRKHLLGNQAPDNIIFKMEPIDERIPSIEDGTSWPILIANYQPTQMANNYLFLRKKDVSEITEPVKLTSEIHTFGESVNLPLSSQLIFAQVEIKPTILGHIASLFYKPSQLHITLKLNNGIEKKYRIIASMAKSGFVISPLIENATEFGMIYGKNGFLDNKLVKSITITPDIKGSAFWNQDYVITFSQIKTPSPIDISKIYKFDEFDNSLSNYKIATAEKCNGSIDMFNGTTPIPTELLASNSLEVSGWLASSVENATLPDAVYVVLTDAQGENKYLETHMIPRPDVAASFKKPGLNGSGYSTTADISTLEGKYTMELAVKTAGKIEICPQFKIPTTIIK